jgi:shikimate kinase
MRIILTGPGKSGKSTVGRLLAERLGLPFYDLAADAERYYEAAGGTGEAADRAWQEGGFAGWYEFMRPFEAAAVEQGLAEHQGHVVELGALQVTYDDEGLRARVRAAVGDTPVVLLLPAEETEQAAQVLEERQRATWHGVEVNEYFVRHPANESLAKAIVYTKDRTPAETVADVRAVLDPADETVVLIGPMGTGKSTTGGPLAEQLGRPRVAMDQVRWDYYKEIGWSEEEQARVVEQGGFDAMFEYWKPFEVHAVERVLAEHAGSVIDFGAGHSVFDDPEQMARVRAALATHPNVILLLPSPDKDETIAILRERMTGRIGGLDLNRFLLTSAELRELATLTVFTNGKTPEATADEIVARLPKDSE